MENKELNKRKMVINFFIIGSIIGTIYEEILNIFTKGFYEPRNTLLYGPFNPVYGLGITFLIIFLYKKKKNFVILWLYASLITGLIEYFSSLIFELLFNIKFWDYSKYFSNINGRTTIIYAIGWGLGGILFIKCLLPFLLKLSNRIPIYIKRSFYYLFIIFLSLDMLLTYSVLLRMNLRNHNIAPITIIGNTIDKLYPNEIVYQKMPLIKKLKTT